MNLESKVSPPAKYFTPFALENSTAGERKGSKKKKKLNQNPLQSGWNSFKFNSLRDPPLNDLSKYSSSIGQWSI